MRTFSYGVSTIQDAGDDVAGVGLQIDGETYGIRIVDAKRMVELLQVAIARAEAIGPVPMTESAKSEPSGEGP